MTTKFEDALQDVIDLPERINPDEAKKLHDLYCGDTDYMHWLLDRGPAILTMWIGQHDRRQRTNARHRHTKETFDTTPPTRLLEMMLTVNDEHRRKQLRHCTGPDLHYIADRYEKTEARSAFLKVVYRKIGDRVGSDEVEDHYTEEQLINLGLQDA